MSDGLTEARRLERARREAYQQGRDARENGGPKTNPYSVANNTIETEAGPMLILDGGFGFGPDLDLSEAWLNGWHDGGGV